MPITQDECEIRTDLTLWCDKVLSAGRSIFPEGMIEVTLMNILLEELLIALLEDKVAHKVLVEKFADWMENVDDLAQEFINALSERAKEDLSSLLLLDLTGS